VTKTNLISTKVGAHRCQELFQNKRSGIEDEIGHMDKRQNQEGGGKVHSSEDNAYGRASADVKKRGAIGRRGCKVGGIREK